MPKTVRAIVNVATGPRYCGGQDRLIQSCLGKDLIYWRNTLPEGSPSHEQTPYAFKIYAIKEALRMGYTSIIWVDSSIVPVKRNDYSLEPLWGHIEKVGHWLPRNYGHMTGSFCSDTAMNIMGDSRDYLFIVPHIIATAFGLDLTTTTSRVFLDVLKDYSLRGAFNGPWRNDNGEASADPRVLGHRHDQTVASVLAHRLGMELTDPPKFIAEQDCPISDETLFRIER